MDRRKVIITALVLTLVIFIGGALAYFTDIRTTTNVFTIGNVEIELKEPSWVASSGLNLTSNKTVSKDPTITNKGANAAYVFVKVEVPYASVTLEGSSTAADTQLFSYTLNTGWTEIGTASVSGNTISHVYAYGSSTAMTSLAKDATTPAVFSTVTFANIKDPAELTGIDTNMKVTAYGIQTENLGVTSPSDIYALFNNQ